MIYSVFTKNNRSARKNSEVTTMMFSTFEPSKITLCAPSEICRLPVYEYIPTVHTSKVFEKPGKLLTFYYMQADFNTAILF